MRLASAASATHEATPQALGVRAESAVGQSLEPVGMPVSRTG